MSDVAPAELFRTIREQHERLFRAVNELSDAALVPDGHPVLAVLLDGLRDLLLTHFADEERFMAQIAYPQASGHKWQHEHLAKEMEELQSRVSSNGDDLTLEDLTEISAIVESHTMEADADLIAFYGRHQKVE